MTFQIDRKKGLRTIFHILDFCYFAVAVSNTVVPLRSAQGAR